MKADRDNGYYLEQIIEHCNRIADFTKRFSGNVETLENDYAYSQCVLMSIIQIGENARKLDEDLREKYNGVNWHEIIGARNKVTHEYDGVDYEIVWNMIEHDIPLLKKYCEKILADKC